MAVTQSPRLGLTRWGAGTDPLRRSQLDADHATLDNLAAIDLQVADLNARPAASTRGRYCFVESEQLVYRDTGTAWVLVGAPAPNLEPYATDVDLANGLAGKANTVHTHAQADVTGLTTALAGKLDTAGGTITGDLVVNGKTTLGDANTDVLRRKALEVETHTRNVTNTYTAGKLTSVVEKAGATTVKTTTLAYTGDQLTTVTEVADGLTITTTLTYNGAGELTGATRTVA